MTESGRTRFFRPVTLLLITCATFLVAGAQNPPVQKTAAQQFKNIQVLKDIPADQLIPAMQFMTASLGVDCEYCHVEHAFDKDDKKTKGFARHMMEMMITINNENFEGHREVTCYTCHQGSPKPVGIPAISAEAKPAQVEPETLSESANPKADSLFDKYLTAVGGAEALMKITSRAAKGTVTAFGDQKLPVELYAVAPDKRISIMHMKDGDSVTAYNGKVGWLSVPGRVHMMNAQEASGARMDADFAFPANVKAMYAKWETNPGERISGQDTWLVVGVTEGQPPLRLYFDQKSNLLVRLIRYTDSPLGYNPTQIDYADYRAVDGVKVPYRWTVARPGNRFTIQLEQLQQNIPVDDAKFVPPPPPAPPPAH
ncbi:MAG TPA: c-type cytochrome [Dongiaceae bacterium]|nr:c-type cytochrome [Dongiaceae bacterium]